MSVDRWTNGDSKSNRWQLWAGAMSRARPLFVALALGVLTMPAHALVVSIEDTLGGFQVRGNFEAPVTHAVAWEVLTDYEHIGRFVTSVRSSQMERRADGGMLLRQDATGGIWWMRRRVQVLLEVDEDAGRRIVFRDVLGKDFTDYQGAWYVDSDSSGTHVDYELRAEPRMSMPRAVSRKIMRRVARDLLEQVRSEMLRRMLPSSATPSSSR